MEFHDCEWARKGATLSDKTARTLQSLVVMLFIEGETSLPNMRLATGPMPGLIAP
jgi:hypothetical protein